MNAQAQVVGVVAVLLVSTGLAQASFLSFEGNDLDDDGWASTGEASVVDVSYGVSPTDGTYQALIETTTGSGPDTDDIETFLDLNEDSLADLITEDPFHGSAISIQVSLDAGESVTFDYNFLTDEKDPGSDTGPNSDDFAFVSLAATSADPELITSVYIDTFTASATPYGSETGYASFTTSPVAAAGTYTLGFGVMQSTSASWHSAMLLDNVAVSSTDGHLVPTPSAAAAGMAAFGLIGATMRRRRVQIRRD